MKYIYFQWIRLLKNKIAAELRFYLFLFSPPFGKLPDDGFNVAAQLFRQTVNLYFFRFFGGVRQILFSTDLFIEAFISHHNPAIP